MVIHQILGLIDFVGAELVPLTMPRHLARHIVVNALVHLHGVRPKARGYVRRDQCRPMMFLDIPNGIFDLALHAMPVGLCGAHRDVMFSAPRLEELVLCELASVIRTNGFGRVAPERHQILKVFPDLGLGLGGDDANHVAARIHDDERVLLSASPQGLLPHDSPVNEP